MFPAQAHFFVGLPGTSLSVLCVKPVLGAGNIELNRYGEGRPINRQ